MFCDNSWRGVVQSAISFNCNRYRFAYCHKGVRSCLSNYSILTKIWSQSVIFKAMSVYSNSFTSADSQLSEQYVSGTHTVGEGMCRRRLQDQWWGNHVVCERWSGTSDCWASGIWKVLYYLIKSTNIIFTYLVQLDIIGTTTCLFSGIWYTVEKRSSLFTQAKG